MSQLQLATRYAKALFEAANDAGKVEQVQSQLNVLGESLFVKENLSGFFGSPLVRPSEKEAAIAEALGEISVSEIVRSFCVLLAKKGRLSIFPEIAEAFQKISDASKDVVRGVVKSSKPLSADEQKALQMRIQSVTNKNPVLNFEVHPELIGGMVADVGSYTFDDSLAGHLTRMKEQLNRSTQ